ncbi:hypothetical protein [Rubricoccus marinus]|uniref:hypothetical protein n=1 Tax=Rubricoccus marinus TaxID=716817 RepID=UPI001179F11A|nr:hypothetical protein [Rubricoccus marinus]
MVRPALAYVALGLALWPLPVFGLLHAEAAAIVAAFSFFVAGWSGLAAFARGEPLARVARRQLALLAVPLAMLTATLLWRPNCGYGLGLALFALFVPPSVLLGLASADVLHAFSVRRQRLWLTLGGLVVLVVPTVVTLKLHPQLFVYNVLYGGVLGPIYDAELALRPGLAAHRAVAVLWAVGGFALARWRRGEGRGRPLALVSVIAVVLVAAYALSTPLGFTQSESNLRRALPGRIEAGGAVLHYDPTATPLARARAIADEMEYRSAQVERALGVAPEATVHVYLYPDAGTKAALIGSRETSVVPVWLGSPQVHLLAERADGDLGHELVHVVAREFASPITGATWKIGLVEGLAVALEPPEGLPVPEQQVAVAMTLAPEDGGIGDPGAAVRAAMDPLGFWGGRAGAAYSTTGAFVAWLLAERGAAPVRAVYGGASWEAAYGEPLASLTREWTAHMRSVEVSPEAVAYTTWRFGQPSLFEVACPHHVPRWHRLFREGADAWDRGDLATALARFEAGAREPLADSTTALLVRTQLESARMLAGSPEASVRRLGALVARDTAGLSAPRLGLARALQLSRAAGADSAYALAVDALPPYSVQALALTALESQLSPLTLRTLLLPRADSLATVRAADVLAASGEAGAVFGALLRSEAGDPLGAWRLFQQPGDWAARLDPALTLVGARLAYAAGDLAASGRLALAAEEGFSARGQQDAARVAQDLRGRVRWGRRTAR